MKQEMLINVSQPEECRIAIVEDGVLEELYVERAGQDNYVGNIYKGVVVNLEPSIQAAFVDFGVGRNGFLHISDVEPQYFRQGGYDPARPIEPGGRPPRAREHCRDARHERSTSDDVDDVADEDAPPQPRPCAPASAPASSRPSRKSSAAATKLLVQVIKEGIGTKGPTLSTYISIPGRYLVLMPALGRVGVSRKIEDETDPPPAPRHHARAQSAQGAGLHRPHRRLRPHQERALPRPGLPAAAVEGDRPADQEVPGPGRHLRRKRHDHPHHPRHLHRATWIPSTSTSQRPTSGPRSSCNWSCPATCTASSSMKARSRSFTATAWTRRSPASTSGKVPLRTGGSIVIDQTEALVAIDVNSGSFRTDDSAEETAFQMNVLAAQEIARQIRLRDLGGVIVNDFIDMRKEKHRRGVERALRDAVKRDRARTKILRTSPFGLIEMTRQRIRPSLKRSVFMDCPGCGARAW